MSAIGAKFTDKLITPLILIAGATLALGIFSTAAAAGFTVPGSLG